MASWLECSTPDRVVRVRVLAGDIVLCSWARHFTLAVPLSIQAPVVETMDSAICGINHYLVDSAILLVTL